MKLSAVRAHCLALPEVTEEPHHHMGSFRVRGKIFVTVPPGDELLHVFVPPALRDELLAEYPEFTEALLWGGKPVGVRVALPAAQPAVVKAMLDAAWRGKAPKGLG